MLPNQLTPASFATYPPEARQLATRQIALLQRLPLAFLPLLLRELIVYDWKFPSDRADLDRQFTSFRNSSRPVSGQLIRSIAFERPRSITFRKRRRPPASKRCPRTGLVSR